MNWFEIISLNYLLYILINKSKIDTMVSVIVINKSNGSSHGNGQSIYLEGRLTY